MRERRIKVVEKSLHSFKFVWVGTITDFDYESMSRGFLQFATILRSTKEVGMVSIYLDRIESITFDVTEDLCEVELY